MIVDKMVTYKTYISFSYYYTRPLYFYILTYFYIIFLWLKSFNNHLQLVTVMTKPQSSREILHFTQID